MLFFGVKPLAKEGSNKISQFETRTKDKYCMSKRRSTFSFSVGSRAGCKATTNKMASAKEDNAHLS